MKKVSLIFSLLIGFGCISHAQTVTIGTQKWMTKNLDVSTFRNGDTIPQAKTDEEWKKAGENKQAAWCYYDNNPANDTIYGKLYNWFAVNDTRGLAPAGYHIPTGAEWTKLTAFLGGQDVAGKKMKSKSGWKSSTTGSGTNTSGFSGLPGGSRDYDGPFYSIGLLGGWWSSTEASTDSAWGRLLGYYDGDVYRRGGGKKRGLSVRCLRD